MSLLHIAGGATEDKLYVEDVFSTYLYTGNGSTQTINNGIDLAGKGGMVWIKNRKNATWNALFDTARGVNKYLTSNGTDATATYAPLNQTFTSNGFGFNTNEQMVNASAVGDTYASWTFRKAPKFFDIVTYTGNGVAGRQIPHNLGCEVGMIVVKKTSAAGTNWIVYHRALGDAYLILNLTNASGATSVWNNTAPTSTMFTLGNSITVNESGQTYIAYLYAHDPSADGIIQCGSFTPSAGVDSVVSLGWEPQFLLVKSVVGGEVWRLLDVSRGMSLSGEQDLYPNQSDSESTLTGERFVPTATGFYYKTGMVYPNGSAVIYLAIRRPMKVPTSGTEVYNAIARTGTGAAEEFSVGIVPDLVFVKNRPTSTYWAICDRLRAFSSATAGVLSSNATASEFYAIPSNAGVLLDGKTSKNVQYTSGSANTNTTGINTIHHFFKRAKGFFDIVCHTGIINATPPQVHNLGVVPELIIQKPRGITADWAVWTPTSYGYLNKTNAFSTLAWDMDASTFQVYWNGSDTYVTYLFASCPGVSKVGNYTGNGTSQTINCGFTTGARFVLVKRTDSTGDWYVWDTARGIVAANDPHLSLNTTVAEVTTDDSIDPASSGFIVNQVAATNINVNGGSYIFLAIA